MTIDHTITAVKIPSNQSGDTPEDISYWTDSEKALEFEVLSENLNTDVVIVGGGMSGMSIAYSLKKEGKQCIVVEQDRIGEGETSRSSAHLTYALDARYNELEEIYGLQNTQLAAQSHSLAIDQIEKIIKRERINCDFERVDGYMYLHPSDNVRTLQQEFDASRRAGLKTELIPSAPDICVKENVVIKYPQQAQFHPLKYLKGICNAFINSGGRIFTHSKIVSVTEKEVQTNDFRIRANNIVLATNRPFDDRFTMLGRQYTCKSFVIGSTVHKGLITPALWWDSGDQTAPQDLCPYHYARIQPFNEEYDLLICGGEDYVIDNNKVPPSDQQRFSDLEKWARKHFPLMRDVVYAWTGEILQPADLLGYIGKNPGHENIYVVSGDAGNGLTYGSIAGMMIPDLISGRENPWEKLYNPSRLPSYVPEETIDK